LLAEVGATISVHTGPGSIAIAMLPQKPASKAA
jgi:fatty acid-binding protein DegV